jgi:hypothetical protein
MRRTARRVVVPVTALVVALAPNASAQGGNGLYEPFPKAAVEKRAKRFVERLRVGEAVRFSDAELDRGVFVNPGRQRPGSGAASARAGAASESSGIPAIAQVALLALAVTALPLLAARRPRRRVAPG